MKPMWKWWNVLYRGVVVVFATLTCQSILKRCLYDWREARNNGNILCALTRSNDAITHVTSNLYITINNPLKFWKWISSCLG